MPTTAADFKAIADAANDYDQWLVDAKAALMTLIASAAADGRYRTTVTSGMLRTIDWSMRQQGFKDLKQAMIDLNFTTNLETSYSVLTVSWGDSVAANQA